MKQGKESTTYSYGLGSSIVPHFTVTGIQASAAARFGSLGKRIGARVEVSSESEGPPTEAGPIVVLGGADMDYASSLVHGKILAQPSGLDPGRWCKRRLCGELELVR